MNNNHFVIHLTVARLEFGKLENSELVASVPCCILSGPGKIAIDNLAVLEGRKEKMKR
jgi:hypothetical protein